MNKSGCPKGQKRIKGKCEPLNQRIKLTEAEAKKIYGKYQRSERSHSPSMIGVTKQGYCVFPLNPKEALLIKEKNGKYIDGIHVKRAIEKRSWKEATTPPDWVKK